MSMIDIYHTLQPLVRQDFGLEHFDIVLAGQTESEAAPAIILDSRRFNDVIRSESCAFYIRPRSSVPTFVSDTGSNTISNTISNTRSNTRSNTVTFDCPVCLEQVLLSNTMNPFNCSHNICNRCYTMWRNSCHLTVTCPCCRSSLR